MRHAAKADSNQAEIVAALRGVGATVVDLHALGQAGVPDLLVACVVDGRRETLLVECKAAGEQLSAIQERWHQWWRGRVVVVRSAAEALAAIGVSVPVPGRGEA